MPPIISLLLTRVTKVCAQSLTLYWIVAPCICIQISSSAFKSHHLHSNIIICIQISSSAFKSHHLHSNLIICMVASRVSCCGSSQKNLSHCAAWRQSQLPRIIATSFFLDAGTGRSNCVFPLRYPIVITRSKSSRFFLIFALLFNLRASF
jgi:hypothetical protein